MSLLWQLLIEMLSLFFEPTRLLDGVSRFLHGEFSLFLGKQSKHPRSFKWQRYKKICTEFSEEFANFVFDAYYTNVGMKFDDFYLAARKREILSMCQFSKKIHPLERA